MKSIKVNWTQYCYLLIMIIQLKINSITTKGAVKKQPNENPGFTKK